MTSRLQAPDMLLRDIAACLGFYTRLPVRAAPARSFAAAQWAAPVAGAVVGLASGLLLWLCLALGLPHALAAVFALAFGIALTGALHEDGLADVADGFGGGRTRDQKLEIMKDSRLGSYGALALVLSALARWSALVALAGAAPLTMVLALTAAHAASRAPIPLFMLRLPSARTGGLADGVGRMDGKTAAVALALGFVLLFASSPVFALVAALSVAVLFYFLERLAKRQIGGHTGDVLGALQQGGEIAVLAAAAALLV